MNGDKLSTGERQRVVLVNNLLKDILVFDEPIANCNIKTEDVFCKILDVAQLLNIGSKYF